MFSVPILHLVFVSVLFLGKSVQSNSPSGEKPDILNTDLKDGSSPDHSMAKRRSEPLFRCRCWIGWRYSIESKYLDFGNIGLFSQRQFCRRACSKKCAPVLYNRKNYVCGLVKGNYNSRRYRGVGCFSQFGEHDNHRNIWQFNNRRVDLCCKKVYRGYGCERGYYYHRYFRICTKRIDRGCPQDMGNNIPMTPECCINHIYSSCKWPRRRWSYRSVPCSHMRG